MHPLRVIDPDGEIWILQPDGDGYVDQEGDRWEVEEIELPGEWEEAA